MRHIAFFAFGFAAVLFCCAAIDAQNSTQNPTISFEPTTVEFGKHTTIEDAWSKAYGRVTRPREKGELRETVEYAKEHGLTEGMGISGVSCCSGIPGEPPPPLERLRWMACGSDAIVLGSAKRTAAHLFDDDSYVYTSYDFIAKEILRDNPANHIERGAMIQLTLPGGFVMIDGIKILAEMEDEKPLLPGPYYVMFLRYVPGADGYMLSDRAEIYVINGNAYETMAVGCSSAGLPRKGATDELLSFVRTAAAGPCETK